MATNAYSLANYQRDQLFDALLKTYTSEIAAELADSFREAAGLLIYFRNRSIAARRGKKIGRPKKGAA